MKKVILAGLALVLVSCDQSIESRLEKGEVDNTQQHQSTKEEANVNKEYRTPETKKNTEENKIIKENTEENRITEKKENTEENRITEHKASDDKTIEKKSSESSQKNMSITSAEREKHLTNLKKEQSTINKPISLKEVDNKQNQKERNKLKKQLTTKKQEVEKQQSSLGNKNIRNKKQNESDGTYENGKLISTLSEEEQRVGIQRQLTKDEVQYYKSLCRYAYMSEQDVIDNKCETKRVSVYR